MSTTDLSSRTPVAAPKPGTLLARNAASLLRLNDRPATPVEALDRALPLP